MKRFWKSYLEMFKEIIYYEHIESFWDFTFIIFHIFLLFIAFIVFGFLVVKATALLFTLLVLLVLGGTVYRVAKNMEDE